MGLLLLPLLVGCGWAMGRAEAGQCVFRQVRPSSLWCRVAGGLGSVGASSSDLQNAHIAHHTAVHQRRPRLSLHPRADARPRLGRRVG